jgi:hypothetical protein
MPLDAARTVVRWTVIIKHTMHFLAMLRRDASQRESLDDPGQVGKADVPRKKAAKESGINENGSFLHPNSSYLKRTRKPCGSLVEV